MKKVEIYYFSGTGNTLAAVMAMKKHFEERGVETELKRLVGAEFKIPPAGTAVGFAFPINTQSVSPMVWKAMKSLPKVRDIPAFVLATMNESSGMINPLYRLLSSRGFKIAGLCEVSMPNNMLLEPSNGDNDRERTEKGLQQIRRFSDELLSGTASWKPEKKGSAFVSGLSLNTPLPWFFMRRLSKFETDSGACTRCGQCISECEADNIYMKDKPVHRNNCQLCMRCAAFCPQRAISVRVGGKQVEVRKAGEDADMGGGRI